MGLAGLIGIAVHPFAIMGPFVVAVGLVAGPHHFRGWNRFPSWL